MAKTKCFSMFRMPQGRIRPWLFVRGVLLGGAISACGQDPVFITAQTIEVYFSEDHPPQYVTQSRIEWAVDDFTDAVTTHRKDDVHAGQLLGHYGHLDMYVSASHKEVNKLCQGDVWACWRPNEIVMWDPAPCSEEIIPHELGHMVKYFWDGDADAGHQDDQMFRDIAIEARDNFLRYCP